MKTQKRRRRLGTLLFFIPIAVILLVVAYVIVTSLYFNSGTLVVSAQTSGKYYFPKWLNVTAAVSTSSTGITPLHLSLSQGTYTVQFSQQPWFYTPPERTVNLPPGKTVYVVGVYDPLVRTILIANNQFNSSAISAGHDITPVIFVNEMSDYVIIQSGPTGRVTIPPAGNFTYVFAQAGQYSVSMPLGGTSTVNISVT